MKFTLFEWQQIYKNPNDLIVQASSIYKDDSWQEHPIGMGYLYLESFNLGKQLQIGSHTKTVHCGISNATDSYRRKHHNINRQKILSNLETNNITNTYLCGHEYFTSLPNYKFVISPEGNGIDCHRHYEALIAGCIPIMERNQLILEKYKDLPILYTNNYSEITSEYLETIYEQMLNKTYDFSRLFLHNYSPNQFLLIKQQSDFWCNLLVNKTFYKKDEM
jgi:hypothetical protein